MITYTINRIPVARSVYDAASEPAKIQSEIFVRLLELNEAKFDSGADLCRRLATLADLSPVAFKLVLKLGSGDTASIMQSFEDMAIERGRTRQSLHWEFNKEIDRIKFVFPKIAELLLEYRQSIDHKEHAKAKADILKENAANPREESL